MYIDTAFAKMLFPTKFWFSVVFDPMQCFIVVDELCEIHLTYRRHTRTIINY